MAFQLNTFQTGVFQGVINGFLPAFQPNAFQFTAFQEDIGLSFSTNQIGATPDYRTYIYGKPIKKDKLNENTFLDFSLAAYGTDFVKLVRGTRIVVSTLTYPLWFTGYITNDPSLTFLGTQNNVPQYGYTYEATDDSYILNLKPIGMLQPFVNTNAGAIIKALVALLDVDNVFDVSNVAAGPQISRYIVDPNKKFTEILKDFTDPMGFRWRCNNNVLTYQKQDVSPAAIAINGNSKHFNAGSLQVRATSDPFVNDVVVVGTVEPQTYIDEYFLGDGFTANYPLMSSVFGVTSAVLIDETFSGGGINAQNWNIFDPTSTRLINFNGYLNVVGGAVNGSFDTYLQSSSVIALEATLRMTHGQWDFVNAAGVNVNGVIAALWTQAPNSAYTGCVYGIRVNKGGSVTTLNPISAGVVDGSQSLVVDFTKRYIIRTVATFARHQRYGTTYNCRTQNGAVNGFTPSFPNDSVVFQTYLVAVDPTTGALSSPVLWQNTQANFSNSTTFANYVPVASNDLHATVTGITVSYTMAASLDVAPFGNSAVNQIIGPNEIDSLDGLAPVATIVQSQGSSNRNNNLGTVQANPGDAALAFFKDTTKQTTTVPPAKSTIHISYRHAGNAVGRVQDPVSVAAESVAWGDNGIRSITRTDLSPLPRSAAEAEMAAAALLSEYGYQHWEGSYVQDSAYEFSGEPLTGTILQFSNLGPAFPSSLVSAVITEVDSEMVGDRANEHFTHTVHFGKLNRVQAALAGLAGKADVLGVLDPVNTLPFVPLGSVGTVFAPDIVNAALVSVDASNYNFTTNQNPPAGGGFEVRATDDNWGADPSRNLITTITGQTFSVPRTIRGRVCFVRAYDVRNKIIFSEDMTNAAWTKGSQTSASLTTAKNPAGNSTSISQFAFTGPANISNRSFNQTIPIAAAGVQASFSISLKGPAGNTVLVQLMSSTSFSVAAAVTVTLTGRWQRVTVGGTFSGGATGNISGIVRDQQSGTVNMSATWASLEIGTPIETAYFKTNANPWGANSRYSAGLRCNFPLVPPAPTATLTTTDPANPVVNVVLPVNLPDVWGVEIRASDNTTVLYHKDLSDSTFLPTYTIAGNATRSVSVFVYTYNLLGEFSTAFNLAVTIPTPTVTAGPTVDETTGKLVWTATNSALYLVEVATDAGYSSILISKTVPDQFFALDDENILRQRYFRITPKDNLGSGTAATSSHTHTPAAVIDAIGGVAINNTDNTYSVPFQPTPITFPTHPSPFSPWSDELNGISRHQTLRNRFDIN